MVAISYVFYSFYKQESDDAKKLFVDIIERFKTLDDGNIFSNITRENIKINTKNFIDNNILSVEEYFGFIANKNDEDTMATEYKDKYNQIIEHITWELEKNEENTESYHEQKMVEFWYWMNKYFLKVAENILIEINKK